MEAGLTRLNMTSLSTINHRERIYYSKWSKFNRGKFEKNQFSVAIIPYTYEHTNFKEFSVGTKVNLEMLLENMFRDYTATNKLSNY
jgi:hypothetical protein